MATEATTDRPGGGRTMRILASIHADEPGRSILSVLGWIEQRVERARDIAEALASLRSGPDLLIFDFALPDGSSEPLAALIRAADLRARVICSTGLSERRDLADVIKSGADRILMRPFDLAELLSML